MTRINIGIPPKDLHRLHLIAEHKEIVRIPALVKKRIANRKPIDLKEIPVSFRLGTGHVKFFYDKVGYIKDRYIALLTECRKRGYNVTDYSSSFNNVPSEFMGNYTPTEQDMQIINERLELKIEVLKQKKLY